MKVHNSFYGEETSGKGLPGWRPSKKKRSRNQEFKKETLSGRNKAMRMRTKNEDPSVESLGGEI